MLGMILRRLGGALPNVVGVIVVTFLLTRALPGDPAAYFAGPSATQEAIEGATSAIRCPPVSPCSRSSPPGFPRPSS